MSVLSQIERHLRIRTMVEDYILTVPSPLFSPAFILDGGEEAEAQKAVMQMRETAAFLAGIRVSPEQLATIRAALDEAYGGRRKEIRTWINPRTGIELIRNPLRLHSEIVSLATDRFLCGIVERYFRRRIVLADVDLRRVPPMTMAEVNERAATKEIGYTSSHWHRDFRGRQVKIMIYLTDVAEMDSNFAFLPGTHVGHQVRPRRFETSRVSDAWVETCGIAPVECYGRAGTTMVFDTNPVHRLRRKPGGMVRDSVTFYYTPGQEARALDVESDLVARLPQAAQSLFGGRRVAVGQGDVA